MNKKKKNGLIERATRFLRKAGYAQNGEPLAAVVLEQIHFEAQILRGLGGFRWRRWCRR